MHAKGFGELCEMEFALQAMRRGLIVSRPYNETRYDLLVDNKKQVFKIQVKGTRSNGVMVSYGSSKKKLYSQCQIDFFAIYLFNFSSWYLIPVKEITSVKISINPKAKRSKYKKYLEAWSLIQ